MKHSATESTQFYVTSSQNCPYLEGKQERKIFTALQGNKAQEHHDILSKQGFRRSQNVIYRPNCDACNACMSSRINVADFTISKSQKRILNKNQDLLRSVNSSWATEDQYHLFKKYLTSRHSDGGMADMDVFEFAAMIEETPVKTRMIEYHFATSEPKESSLQATCLTDVVDDGLSMVYSFFDPKLSDRSLGTHIILDHIRIAQEMGLPYVYLGFWVQGSRKMDYKARFSGLEIFQDNVWKKFADVKDRAQL